MVGIEKDFQRVVAAKTASSLSLAAIPYVHEVPLGVRTPHPRFVLPRADRYAGILFPLYIVHRTFVHRLGSFPLAVDRANGHPQYLRMSFGTQAV